MTKRGEDISTVEIRPGVGTLGMFKFMDYTTWYAVAEFVDNSVASWQAHRRELTRVDGPNYALQIRIKLDPSDGGELRIWDNAAGISAADYRRAFKPAERPLDQTTLSRYGMGMKTAACWFSDHWRVTSKALGEAAERTIEFDIPSLIKQGQERIKPATRSADVNDHWTELVLWELNQIPVKRNLGKIKDYLSQMYRRFITSDGVEIYWNDDLLEYKERAVLVAPYYKDGDGGSKRRWEKALDFELPKGERVTGRALLFEKGEQSAAGLHLFWRGRMIKGNLEDFYRPKEIFQFAGSFRVQRLLVELDLDAFTPAVDKQDFIWARNNSSEQDLLNALKAGLNKKPLPLLEQADNYRSTKLDRSTKEAASKAARATAEAVEEKGAADINRQAGRSSGDDSLPRPNLKAANREYSLTLDVRGATWQVAIQLSEQPEHRSEWLAITDRPSTGKNGVRRLGIRISLTNPFTVRFATDDRSVAVLVRLAAGIALAEIAAREAGGNRPGDIRRNLNELLLNVLADS